ncbi:hypothetical protein [Sphaerisporangium sp. NPDC051011]|uniref:hypothetical protein n=1 Tax=Sphaerisporangium sp. NPDC051011 TaxID=3155792 RepID=UPI0033D96814
MKREPWWVYLLYFLGAVALAAFLFLMDRWKGHGAAVIASVAMAAGLYDSARKRKRNK